jgi:hypothetical protein
VNNNDNDSDNNLSRAALTSCDVLARYLAIGTFDKSRTASGKTMPNLSLYRTAELNVHGFERGMSWPLSNETVLFRYGLPKKYCNGFLRGMIQFCKAYSRILAGSQ